MTKSVPRFPPETVFTLVAGLAWIQLGSDASFLTLLSALLPGGLLLAGGFATPLLPGDVRTPQLTATGAAIGMILALPMVFAVGIGGTLILLLLSAASFIAAGWTSQRFEPAYAGVPNVDITPLLAAKVALDEVNLFQIDLGRDSPLEFDPHQMRDEVSKAREFYTSKGWLEKPSLYHNDPPPLTAPVITKESFGRLKYEHLRFNSEYEPDRDEPGRDRWLSYVANREAHAWVYRHASGKRPWLICIHGYGMGIPAIDIGAFKAEALHKAGMNVVLPVLPLHGPRKAGRRSGDRMLEGAFLNTVHTAAQAVWDIRRLIFWARAHGATKVGLYGLSLGGYTAALVSSIQDEIDMVISGIPASDLTRLARRIGPPHGLQQLEEVGFSWDDLKDVQAVVSPLSFEPKVAKESRYIFAAIGDKVVSPDQSHALWQHWDRPQMVWYPGSHLTVAWEPSVQTLVRNALNKQGFTVQS